MGVETDRAKTIVIVEWVLFALAVCVILIVGIFFIDVLNQYMTQDDTEENRMALQTFVKVAIGLVMLSVIISLGINILLTKGVHSENTCCCKTWYIVNIIYAVFAALNVVTAIITLNILVVVFQGAALAYRIYAIKTIMTFADFLRNRSNNAGVVYNVPGVQVYPNNTNVYNPPSYEKSMQNPC